PSRPDAPSSAKDQEDPGLYGKGAALIRAGRAFFSGDLPVGARQNAPAGALEKIPGKENFQEGILSARSAMPPIPARSGPDGSAGAFRPVSSGRSAIPRGSGQGLKMRRSGHIPRLEGIGMEDTRKKGEAPRGGSASAPLAGKPLPLEKGPFGADIWMESSFRQNYSLRPSGISGAARAEAEDLKGAALAGTAKQPAAKMQALRALPGGMSFGATRPVDFPARDEGAAMAVQTASHKRPSSPPVSSGGFLLRAMRRISAGISQDIGALAAKFESGAEGIAAIGYDRHGGTSYGKFQIASRVGTMGKFLRYLEDKAPDLAARLNSCGPANTGGRAGRMPEAWKNIAAEDPGRFESLQNDFIRESHFEPTMEQLAANTGVSFATMPPALQEVVFSTAVQHGPGGAFRIISRALSRVGEEKFRGVLKSPEAIRRAGEDLIKQIYSIRAGQFASSSRQIQEAARERLRLEMREALTMLT
ncbi:MAG: chitosanase, partial [Deltaproteobacteria bacterium]|nr:chitosanase [Deltaproteobacteria bacterium]